MEKKTKAVQVGSVVIGGGAPVSVQSMTTTDTRDVRATISQIRELELVGCEIVRVAVLDEEAAQALKRIQREIRIPLVADIHFDYRLALIALDSPIAKLRINPGNIGAPAKTEAVVRKAKEKGVPIRIGVNLGSLEKRHLEKYGRTAEAMVESALDHVGILERFSFYDTLISLKASHVKTTFLAYQALAKRTSYPLHLGITEAGSEFYGTIKSAAGLGALLLAGIGDTLRVSLTADPQTEVRVARALLQALELRQFGVTFVSCPTCGRTTAPLIDILKELEEKTASMSKRLTVAVMGCPVNGIGEAKHADLGIAMDGKNGGILFKKGEVLTRLPLLELQEALLQEIKSYE